MSYTLAVDEVTRAITPSATRRGPRRTIPPGAVAFVVWSLLVGLSVLVNAASVHPGFAQQLVWMSVVITGYGLITARIMSRRETLRSSLAGLKLGPWFGVGFAVVFGPTSLIWLQQIRPYEPTENASVIDAGWIVLVGLAALFIGYMASPRQLALPYKPRRLLTPSGPGATAVIVLWALAIISQGLSLSTGALGYLTPNPSSAASTSLPEILTLLRNLGFLASLLAGWRLAQRPRGGTRLLGVLVVGSQIALSLFSGLKEPALTQMVAFLVGYAALRRVKVRWVVAVVVAFVLLVIPFVTLYRSQVAVGGARLSPAQSLAQISFGSLAHQASDTPASKSWTEFAARLSRIGDVAIIKQKTPGLVPEESPSELLEAPILGIVPRSLWPGKPVLNAGSQMAQIYYGSRSATSSAVTPEGDLWKHGGTTPLLVGMFAFGFLLSTIDRREGSPALDPRVLFLPMLLFSAVVKEETDFTSFIASLATTAIISALATWLVGHTSPSLPSKAPPPKAPTITWKEARAAKALLREPVS